MSNFHKIILEFLRKSIYIFGLTLFTQVIYCQTIENSIIELPRGKVELKSVLEIIEQKTEIRFAYSASKIPVNKKVEFSENSMKLSEFLEYLSNQFDISYYISGTQVALFQTQSPKQFTVSGYIEDAKTSERLIAANIYNDDFKGTISNNYGYYSFTQPTDYINLNYSYIGYKSHSINLNLQNDTFINIKLEPNAIIKELEITGREKMLIDELDQRNVHLPFKLIDNIPTIFGEGDLMKAIQLTPGAQSGLENTNGISIRGGGPGQNIILLDGVQLYHYNHLLGLLSVFDNDIIKSSKLIKSGMPAYYGGRASSCIDIRLKEGNMNNYLSEISIGFPSNRFYIEGPILKGKSSFVISARRTYQDIFAKLKNIFASEENIRYYNYYDITTKLNYKFSNKSRLYISYYSGSDKYYNKTISEDYLQDIYFRDINQLKWGNNAAIIRWNYLVNNKLFSNFSLSYSRSNFIQDDEYFREQDLEGKLITEKYTEQLFSSMNDVSAKLLFDYQPNINHSIKCGYDFNFYFFEPNVYGFIYSNLQNFYSTEATSKKQNTHSIENALFIDDQILLGDKIKTNVGLRTSVYQSQNKTYIGIDPRLSANISITDKFSFLLTGTRTTQFVHLLTYTNLILPTDQWVGNNNKIKPIISDQFSVGMNFTISDNISFSTEGYYKYQKNITSYTDGPNFLDMNLGWDERVEQGIGRNIGVEFLLQKVMGKATGWISYTISRSTMEFPTINSGREFLFQYDKPHILNIVFNYKIKENIEFGSTWVYTSGMPFTFTRTAYESAIDAYGYNIFYYENIGYDIEDVENKRNTRMPPYHRLDVSLKAIKPFKRADAEIKIGAYNAYNRLNPVFMYAKEEIMYTMSVFPVIPFIQLKIRFNKNIRENSNDIL